jgi:hypothetical protein
MKKNYTTPELYEIKVEDVIAASELKIEREGGGLSLDFSDLL